MKSCVVLSCLPKLKHNILRYRKAFILDFCSDAGTAEFYTERIRLFERVKVVWFFFTDIHALQKFVAKPKADSVFIFLEILFNMFLDEFFSCIYSQNMYLPIKNSLFWQKLIKETLEISDHLPLPIFRYSDASAGL